MKVNNLDIQKLLMALLIALMTFLSTLLFVEYRSVKQQLLQVVEMQEEYQTYTSSMRKMMRDYQRLKEGEDELSSEEDDEKKKEQVFLVVNREPEYLRRSTARFLRKHRMESALDKVYPAVEDYKSINEQRATRRIKRAHRRPVSKGNLLANQLRQRRSLLFNKAYVNDIRFEWPVDRSQFWLSSFFGARRKPDRTWGFHYGIDMAAIKGTPVMAAAAGVVVEAGNNKGYGNTVVIMHNKKYKTRYAHLHRIYVRRGQSVETGQTIGSVGDTGLVRKRGRSASHLHFEVYVYGKKINPLYFFV